MSNDTEIVAKLHSKALELGFSGFGITTPNVPQSHLQEFRTWLANGNHGQMQWLRRHLPLREDLGKLLPNIKSVIALFFPYSHPVRKIPAECGRVSSYAYGKDYHKHIKKRLKMLGKTLEELVGKANWRAFVDSGPIPERTLAMQAGLGFIGKNRALIVPDGGSFGFLAFLLVDVELAPSETPLQLHAGCGSCTRCIKACPTGALSESTFDARRCIGYLTVEYDGFVPLELAQRFGDRIFGCDLCQQACPYNKNAVFFDDWRNVGLECLNLAEVLSIPNEEIFKQRFAGTSLRRAGRNRLVRNAIIVAMNKRRMELLPKLEELAKRDRCPFVQEQAAAAIEILK